jgi:hypothetical protein
MVENIATGFKLPRMALMPWHYGRNASINTHISCTISLYTVLKFALRVYHNSLILLCIALLV